MKKSNCAILFLIIFMLFVLPPLFSSAAVSSTRMAVYPLQIFVNAACMALVVYLQKNGFAWKPLYSTHKTSVRTLINTGNALITFGVLCTTDALLQIAMVVCKKENAGIQLLPPDTVLRWVNCIIGTVAAAFFEEALYRRYLPDTLHELFVQSRRPEHKRLFTWITEALVIILFAVSHRYLGIFGVINAGISGTALRVCTLKTGSIKSACIAHTAYNALVLVLSFALQKAP